jgi:NADP-dependent 3-hydroxy acid dehydrogenase YdfG
LQDRRTNREQKKMDVQDKVIIVTGASTGIGLAAAQLLTQHGARVGLLARSAERLAQVQRELPGSFAVSADLGDVDAIEGVIRRFHEHFGRIDVLVNNAGRAMHVPIEQADVHQYRAMLDLNVVSVLRAMQCVIPIMRAQGGGVIVNISSGLSKRIVPGVGPYASSKYALNALTLTARAELEPDNIRVCLMLPSRTADTQFAVNGFNIIPGRASQTPQSYVGGDSPQHVADKILESIRTEAAEVYVDSIRPQA